MSEVGLNVVAIQKSMLSGDQPAFDVTVPAIEFVPSPVAFHTASVNGVCGGRPPMLYGGGVSVDVLDG